MNSHRRQALERGEIDDDLIYFHMAVMCARSPDELASFASPTREDMEKVSAMLVQDARSM